MRLKIFRRRRAAAMYRDYLRAVERGYPASAMSLWLRYREFCIMHDLEIDGAYRGWP